jgi:glyoxylase-like metal-dependent hydrolase (beta-lactamase superfamily II)
MPRGRPIARPVADGVRRFDNGVVNWYVVEDNSGVALIDAGFPPDWDALAATLREMERSLDDLSDVVLTHAHIDHVGFAERARSEAGARVWAHPQEASTLARPRQAPPSERLPLLYLRHPAMVSTIVRGTRGRALAAKPVRQHRALHDGQTLEDVPGRPRVVFSPGHCAGHCAFHLEDRDVLFTGDALVTRDPYTGRTGPRLMPRLSMADSVQAAESLDRLAETGARTLLPGHGEPWHGDPVVAARLAREAGAA